MDGVQAEFGEAGLEHEAEVIEAARFPRLAFEETLDDLEHALITYFNLTNAVSFEHLAINLLMHIHCKCFQEVGVILERVLVLLVEVVVKHL